MDTTLPSSELHHATSRVLIETLHAGATRVELLGLHGSSAAYLLACQLAAGDEILAILCSDQKQAQQLAADLAFYHGHPGEIFYFPHWEVRPYEPLTPHPEVEATAWPPWPPSTKAGPGPSSAPPGR